jgi:ATP-binding cassette subfamily B protein
MLNPDVHKNPLRFFFAVNNRQLPVMALNCFFYSLGQAFSFGIIFLLGRMVDFISSGKGDTSFLVVLLLVCLVLHEVFYRLGHICELFLLSGLRSNIKKALFDHTSRLSFSYFADRFAGEITHKIASTADALERMTVIVTNEFIENGVLVPITAVSLGCLHPWYGLFILLWTAYVVAGSWLLAKEMNRRASLYAVAEARTGGILVDVYGNIGTVKVYGRSANADVVHRQISTETDAYKKLGWWDVLTFHFQGTSIVLLIGGLIAITVILFQRHLLSIGDIVFMSAAALRLKDMAWGIGKNIADFIRFYGEVYQNLSDLVVPPAVKTVPPMSTMSGIVVSASERNRDIRIDFKNVEFSYVPGHAVLSDFSLEIVPGQKVGVVGLSGAGKTTLANLLLRFFDPQRGVVLFNGIDIREFTQESLRSHISHISQDTSLFHDTIAANIAYGVPHAPMSEIKKVAKLAYADEFISMLPQGYESIVGDRGIKLSGGQRQRVSIARAILADRPIFLLDEATSALDSDSEGMIQNGLAELMCNKTVIAIAHRLSTLSKMDRIIFLEKGRIVEDGSPEALLKLGGKYARLWRMQAGGFLPAV